MVDPNSHAKLKSVWDAERGQLKLVGELRGEQLAAEAGELLAAADTGRWHDDGTATIDLSDVGSFNTSGIGILIQLHFKLSEQGLTMRLVGASPNLRSSLALVGISRQLGVGIETAVTNSADRDH